MFENVDGRRTDGRTTDAGVTGILLAHLRAFGSGELKKHYVVSFQKSSLDGMVQNMCSDWKIAKKSQFYAFNFA